MRRFLTLSILVLALGAALFLLARWRADEAPGGLGAPAEPALITVVERETQLVELAHGAPEGTPEPPIAEPVPLAQEQEEVASTPSAPVPPKTEPPPIVSEPAPLDTDTLRREIDATFELAFGAVDSPTAPAASLEGVEVVFGLHLVTSDRDATEALGVPSGSRAIRRTYERITAEWRVDSSSAATEVLIQDEDVTSPSSPLAGESVRFVWDAQLGAYRARLEGDPTRVDLARLEGLEEDLGLAPLAPPDGSVEGSRWAVDADVLTRFLQPGGDLQFAAEGEGPFTGWIWGGQRAAAEYDGHIELVLGARLQRGGRELQEVALEVEAIERFESDDVGAGATFEITFTGEGELTWDAAAGRVHDLELESEVEAVFAVKAGDQETLRAELEGTARWTWKTRAER